MNPNIILEGYKLGWINENLFIPKLSRKWNTESTKRIGYLLEVDRKVIFFKVKI